MIFLMLGTLHGDPTPHLAEEMRVAASLRERGFLKDLWLRADMSGVVGVLEADGEPAARETLQEFPLVRLGLYEMELVELLTPPAGPPGAR